MRQRRVDVVDAQRDVVQAGPALPHELRDRRLRRRGLEQLERRQPVELYLVRPHRCDATSSGASTCSPRASRKKCERRLQPLHRDADVVQHRPHQYDLATKDVTAFCLKARASRRSAAASGSTSRAMTSDTMRAHSSAGIRSATCTAARARHRVAQARRRSARARGPRRSWPPRCSRQRPTAAQTASTPTPRRRLGLQHRRPPLAGASLPQRQARLHRLHQPIGIRPVGLVDHEHVRDLHDAGLQRLHVVAGPGHEHARS